MKLDIRKDIVSREDVVLLVNKFYQRVRQDTLIGPVFNEIIGKHWAEHLQKIYDFWESRLFDTDMYEGNPLKAHRPLPIDVQHFNRWLKLWNETINECFVGEIAEKAKWKAKNIANFFLKKINETKGEE